MGLFDLFKKKTETSNTTEEERLQNYPEMLSMKLLFVDKPNIDADKILEEAKKYFDKVENPSKEDALIFSFPDFQVQLADAEITAQCLVVIPDNQQSGIEIPDVAFQQNWHWQEAKDVANTCKYELLVTDFMTRTLAYKQRLVLFMNFVVAVTKATKPTAIYSAYAQKIINPIDLIDLWSHEEKPLLYGICNVRLYNLTNTDEILMDTIGLNCIGLPDFQIKFKDNEANEIGGRLWDYAYYIYEQGDVIDNGNTLEGVVSGSKWKCERQPSIVDQDRIVINVLPN